MTAFHRYCSAVVCALTVFGSSGCSNPASETPVALTPGLYSIKVGSFGKANEQICFSGSDAENVDRVINKYYAFLEEGCPHKADERVGNAVSGTISCKIDPTSGWTTTYAGTVSADSLTIDAKVVNYAPQLGSQEKREEVTTEGRLSINRVGDCS